MRVSSDERAGWLRVVRVCVPCTGGTSRGGTRVLRSACATVGFHVITTASGPMACTHFTGTRCLGQGSTPGPQDSWDVQEAGPWSCRDRGGDCRPQPRSFQGGVSHQRRLPESWTLAPPEHEAHAALSPRSTG